MKKFNHDNQLVISYASVTPLRSSTRLPHLAFSWSTNTTSKFWGHCSSHKRKLTLNQRLDCSSKLKEKVQIVLTLNIHEQVCFELWICKEDYLMSLHLLGCWIILVFEFKSEGHFSKIKSRGWSRAGWMIIEQICHGDMFFMTLYLKL